MPKIEEVYAFTTEKEGNEDIAVVKVGHNLLPLVAPNKDSIEKMRPLAVGATRNSGKMLKLVRFKQREELETIEG
jgi:hypothetical protein